MSIRIIILCIFLFGLSGFVFCQSLDSLSRSNSKNEFVDIANGLNAISRPTKDNGYKGYFFQPRKYNGNLIGYLTRMWQLEEKHVFSNRPNLLQDSIYIHQEMHYELSYSQNVKNILLESMQYAYSFHVRDTFLQEYETVYIVKVGDENRLKKFSLYDYEFRAGTVDSENTYKVSYVNGHPLEEIIHGLYLLKTKENADKSRFRIISDIGSENTGLYTVMIPRHKYNVDGERENFDSLLDINPVIWYYGLQVQKVTRPVIGKVIDFFEKRPDNYPVPYQPKIGQ